MLHLINMMHGLNYLSQMPPQVFGMDALLATVGVTALIVVLIIWSIVWKGMAMWRAAKEGSKVWFIVFLLVNTVGILEIIYIYFIAGKKRKFLWFK